jgi:DHA1 family multidrug resistance protein-like MFS transporter
MAEALGNSPMGTLSDRVGRRRMMVLGASISVFTSLATGFLRVPPGVLGYVAIGTLLLLRLMDGLGAAMLWPAVFATVGDRVEPSRQAQAMSVLNITYLIGIALGPMVGGLANETLGARYAVSDPRHYMPSFFVAAACFAVTAVVAYLVAPTRAEHKTRPRETAPEIAAGLPRDTDEGDDEGHGKASLAALKKALRDVPLLMLLGFLIFFGVGLIGPYAKTFIMDRFGIGEFEFARLLIWPALVIGAASLPIGRLADHWGKSRAIHVGLAICAAALWTLMFMQHEWSVVLVGSLLGIGFIMAFPAYMAYLADLTGPEDRAGMIGAVRMAQGIGALLGAAVSSVLYTVDSRHFTVFITASILVTLGWLVSLFSIHPRRRPPAM